MKPILPWWQIGLLLIACGAGIFFLLPDDPQLIDNLLRDGQTKEARRQFDKVSPAKRAQSADRYRLLELQLARRELPPDDPPALDGYWRRALGAWRESRFADAIFFEFRPSIARLRDPAAAWSALAPDFSRAPDRQRAWLVEDFTRAALAAGQEATAAEVFAAGQPAANRTPTDALELARLWQLAGRADAALAALGEDLSPAVTQRRLELLRALNRSREALTLLRARFAAQPDLVAGAAAVEEFGTVALQAGAPAEAVPIYQRHLEKNPRDLAALRRLRDLLVAAGQPAVAAEIARQAAALSARDGNDGRELARILEWSGAPGAAFDAWLEVARAGDLAALDRLIALNPGLYRDNELVAVLERVVPVANRGDYTLHLARLEVTQGRYEQARDYYERYLTAEPASVDVMIELARLLTGLNRFDDAETWLRRGDAARPGDPVVRREIAAVLVLQGRHIEALALYADLARHSPGEDIIEPYTRLAESLGRYDELVRGLRLRIAQAAEPSARDYLMLAYGHEVSGDSAQRRAALDEGLRKLPGSDELRLQLAIAFAASKDFARAQTTLAAHPRLREDPAATALFLETMRLNNDTAAERDFLATPFADAVASDESVRERLARAREGMREYAEAERLWRELLAARPQDPERTADLARVLFLRGRAKDTKALLAPLLREPTPPILRLAADIAQAAGDHRAAERYQVAYLAARRSAPATEWSALGDIRLTRGDRAGAKRAYAEALRRLQAQIASQATTP